jgi:hypothetical protein
MKTIRPKFAMNSLLVAVCLALFAAACAAAYAQSTQSSPKPITLKGLEDALKIGGLKDSELIGQIQSRGVDFILTSKITDALHGLGASDAVIQAVGANYRGTSQSGNAHANPTAPSAPGQPPPAQQPVTGMLHYQGPPVPYGGTVVFDNLPKARLKFSFDATAWRMVIRINPDGTKKVILSSLKQGFQTTCDLGWQIVD